MLSLESLQEIFQKNEKQILNDFFTFLRFKSIATDPDYKVDVEKCADWLTQYLRDAGLKVEKWKKGEHAPVIFATDLRAGKEKETLLIYCHYDVQPVDPLDEWLSPPFEPTVRDGEIYARGALDNKGQCFYTTTAIKHLLSKLNTLPVNLKFIIEGEEESGSTGLSLLLKEKQEALKADYLLIVDSGIEKRDHPAITLGARGIVCFNVSLQEAQFDLHSGVHGGIAYNPNRALVELLATLHDDQGSVAIPGFYDEIVEISPREKEELSFDFSNEEFKTMFGYEPSAMEGRLSPLESSWLRPTLEINGISGGYAGRGFKTVIPAKASSKISCRLVPYQDPHHIAILVTEFLKQHAPKGMQLDITVYPGSGKGFRSNPNTKIAQVMCESYSEVFKKPCGKILIGGSIPVAVELAEAANSEVILVGLGLPDDHIHAPNEHFGIDRFKKGYLTIARAIELLDKM